MKISHVFLGILICGMFMAITVGLFVYEPPEKAREPLLILVGSLSAAFGAVVQYFFGSSSSSAQKNDLLSRMAPPPAQRVN